MELFTFDRQIWSFKSGFENVNQITQSNAPHVSLTNNDISDFNLHSHNRLGLRYSFPSHYLQKDISFVFLL